MAETVYSGSVEPDQARTCEGNKRNNHFLLRHHVDHLALWLMGLYHPFTH
ncbi:hypothetical protein GCM10009411_10510 [Shewanella litoralis]|uniref:Uncharacterized protein n=1 Tax=Shewanella litoralis TaxID=2282700 RepID=A0ABQ2R3H5_9GAMM|nr:hypothetical protein GCM10009411_10510 [Shewanella litoralis]